MESITANEGSEITLTANAFTKTGYTFAKWNTSEDGSGKVYEDKDKIKLTSNTTLYAQWTANNYTVKFDKNADDATGAMESQTFTYGTPQALNENKFTRTGYDFVGWATSLDGEVTYNDKQDYSIGAENVILYAKWDEKDKVAKVIFSSTGGEIDNGDTVTLSCATEGATIYYVLVSGTQTPDLSKKEEYKAPITITDDITIVAVAVKDGMNQSDVATATFTVKTYTVTFSTAHGTAPEKITGLKKGSKLTSEQLPTLTATGYTFGGWYNENSQFTANTEITADITLTAQWTANTYKVKFDKNAKDATGNAPADIPATYDVEFALPENTFAKIGYKFAGWNIKADGSENSFADKANVKNLTAENGATVTLYAQWTATVYNINYELDGGTNAADNPTSYTIEDSITLKEPTKASFTFVCWYSDRSKKTEIAKGATGDIVLQALWKNDADFVKVPAVSINGSESWTPDSEVFVSGRALNLKAFWMSDHEVTRGEYKEIIGSAPSSAAAGAYDKDGNELTGNAADNNPVIMVSWYDAIVYCNKRSIKEVLTPCYTINGSTDPDSWGTVPTKSNDTWNAATCNFTVNGYRLPTEAEWEWAARGGEDNTIYAGSDNIDDVAWYTGNTNDTGTRDVKTKKANGYGLYDMSGNLNEWCWDWWSENISSNTPATGGRDTRNHSRRGGSWNLSWDEEGKVVYRVHDDPDYGRDYIGFRVVRTAE